MARLPITIEFGQIIGDAIWLRDSIGWTHLITRPKSNAEEKLKSEQKSSNNFSDILLNSYFYTESQSCNNSNHYIDNTDTLKHLKDEEIFQSESQSRIPSTDELKSWFYSSGRKAAQVHYLKERGSLALLVSPDFEMLASLFNTIVQIRFNIPNISTKQLQTHYYPSPKPFPNTRMRNSSIDERVGSLITLIGCCVTCLQAWHCNLSTIFLVVLA